MTKNYVHNSKYFYGNKISDYGIKHGYVDFRTLAKSFDMVLNNNIINYEDGYDNWELINGSDYNEEYDEYIEVFQYYIISDNGADILQELTDEIVYYNEKLDMYLWGITHYGTSWDNVLTDIKVVVDGKC